MTVPTNPPIPHAPRLLAAIGMAAALALLPAHAGAQTAPAPAACPPVVSAAEAPGPDTVTLHAAGDLVLSSDWPEDRYPPGFDADAAAQLKAALGEADVTFGNLEGALTAFPTSAKIRRAGHVYAFRMPPRFADLFRQAGFTAIAIANNHTLDFGPTGLADTGANLTRAGILVVGETGQVALQTVKGLRLAWIGFSYLDRNNSVRDPDALPALLAQARAAADFVIVSMQAGAEGSDYLRVRDADERFLGEQRGNTFAFAHRAVELGADLVVGHGPHVLRGMECYRGKLIAYSLGNFVGYDAFSIKRAAAITALLEVRLARQSTGVGVTGFRVLPMRFTEHQFPQPDPEQLALALVNDLSRLPPLNGSVRLPFEEAGRARYRAWVAEAGLDKQLGK